jgi:small-conductance mechanosensitive channel
MNILDIIPIESFKAFVDKLPNALFVLAVSYLSIRIIQVFASLALRTARLTRPMQDILLSILSTILWLGLIALVFQSLGLNQIALALSGSVAIIGIFIATGANKLVSDILAGIFLARNRDFRIGQYIKITEVEGKIYSLDSRKVRVLGKDDTIYIIPNTKFDENVWQLLPEKTAKEEK